MPSKLIITRFLLLFALVLTFFCEFLIYYIIPFIQWPDIKCDENDCAVVLLVADPQILGEKAEFALARYDSDRFLRNTFSIALQWVKPNGIIFLGDLMDEGSKADNEQFYRYYNRFKSIFQFQELKNNNISINFVPGDNDIGGENNEIIKASVVNRFRKHFGRDEISNIRHIFIVKINKLLRTYSQVDDLFINKFVLNIAVSHVPLTDAPGIFSRNAIRDLKPEIIFSAHSHKSFAISTVVDDGRSLYVEELNRNLYKEGEATWSFQISSLKNFSVITEIIVPTCSYRMGVVNMAYGVLVHRKNRTEITYHLLWLPSRFYYISFYIVFLILSSMFFICGNSKERYIKRCIIKFLKLFSVC